MIYLVILQPVPTLSCVSALVVIFSKPLVHCLYCNAAFFVRSYQAHFYQVFFVQTLFPSMCKFALTCDLIGWKLSNDYIIHSGALPLKVFTLSILHPNHLHK